jgi:hypothetical protein
VYASCPSGEIALSGGWAIPPDPGDNVFRSQRAGAGNWAVYVKHASSVTVKTYAECLANASGATIAERLTQVSIEAKGEDHDFATATASCNAGEVVIGGGFAASSGDVEISGTYMAASGQWQAFAVNHGASSALLNAYAECLTYRGARSSMTRIKLPGTSVAKDTTGSAASYPCPSGAYVSGGGYGYNAAQGLIYDMSVEGSGSSATWTVYLRYNGDGSGSLYPYAMCLGF